MKQKNPKDPTKTMGLYAVCSGLARERYDLTTNVSVLDGMTTAAEGGHAKSHLKSRKW